MFKGKLAGLVIAAALLGAGVANAQTAFPGNADEGSNVLPARSTYADRYREMLEQPLVTGTAPSAFPGNADEGSNQLPALSTYADQYRGSCGDVAVPKLGRA
jgi:hypothetical protein